MRFDHVGVFTYSHEEGTAAGGCDDDVPARVKERRQRRLMSMQRRRGRRRPTGAEIGQHVRVLVDGPSPGAPAGPAGPRSQGQAPEIDSVVYLSEADPTACRPATLVDAEVSAARGYDLVARPLLASEPA